MGYQSRFESIQHDHSQSSISWISCISFTDARSYDRYSRSVVYLSSGGDDSYYDEDDDDDDSCYDSEDYFKMIFFTWISCISFTDARSYDRYSRSVVYLSSGGDDSYYDEDDDDDDSCYDSEDYFKMIFFTWISCISFPDARSYDRYSRSVVYLSSGDDDSYYDEDDDDDDDSWYDSEDYWTDTDEELETFILPGWDDNLQQSKRHRQKLCQHQRNIQMPFGLYVT